MRDIVWIISKSIFYIIIIILIVEYIDPKYSKIIKKYLNKNINSSKKIIIKVKDNYITNEPSYIDNKSLYNDVRLSYNKNIYNNSINNNRALT